MENNVVNVAFILDDGFVIPTATAITSLIENKNVNTVLRINLVVSNLEECNVNLFKSYNNNKDIFINIVFSDSDKYRLLHVYDSTKPCCATISALLKFDLPILFEKYDKILYLDGDIIVQKDLSDLYNTDLDDNYVAAVKDSGRIYYKSESTKHIKNYFNSGVMLLNLKKMREDNVTKKLFELKANSNDNSLMDQNIFNILFENQVCFKDIKYNFLYLNLVRAKKKYKISEINDLYHSKYKNLLEIYKKAYIIHFSSKDKPWKFKNSLCSNLWLSYFKKTPFYKEDLEIQTLVKDDSDILCENRKFKCFRRIIIRSHKNKLYSSFFVLGIKFNFRDKKLEDIEKNSIISLTSYPARINTVEQTIKSLLNQTLNPKKIVLALGEDNFPNKENDLPESLRSLLSDKFEILWTPKDLRSYKKLVPALKEYPNDIIVTADDDVIYKKDWLEKLYEAYKKEPSLIHCHRAHRITFDKNKKIMPYLEWVWGVKKVKPSFNNFFTGAGGVLYPPNVLNKDVFNIELFQKLAPLADDIWFWAMAVLNDIKVNVIKKGYVQLEYVENTQDNGLFNFNVNESKNDEQLNNVLEKYPQILEKLDKKKFRNVSFLQSLFSITNLPSKEGKWYRTVYFLGFKLSFRNKKKEGK